MELHAGTDALQCLVANTPYSDELDQLSTPLYHPWCVEFFPILLLTLVALCACLFSMQLGQALP